VSITTTGSSSFDLRQSIIGFHDDIVNHRLQRLSVSRRCQPWTLRTLVRESRVSI